MSKLFRLSFVLCTLLFGFSAPAMAQAPQVCDESWTVDKAALSQAFSKADAFLAKRGPAVINLKALGATEGQLVIVYSPQDLECARQLYETQLSGSGMITICKRPKC
jgi:hypothetical protein